ncbi:MAG: flavodoxin family protein [bacterium]|nr:flavodoxin family protein [bacterium]
MSERIGRRDLIGTACAAAAVGALGVNAAAQDAAPARRIIAVNCSPRKGMTTSAALQVCLDAVKEQNAEMQTELIELADLSIPAQLAAGQPLKEGEKDDFPAVAEKLGAADVAGIIVGSPVYFSNMSALCKAFLDRCIVFRKSGFVLSNKVAGVVAVGGSQSGGQELTVQSIKAALTSQEMLVVGTAKPSARIGAMFQSQSSSIEGDEKGIGYGKDLGRRMAEIVAKLAS